MAVIYDISEKMKLEADLKESLEKTNRISEERWGMLDDSDKPCVDGEAR